MSEHLAPSPPRRRVGTLAFVVVVSGLLAAAFVAFSLADDLEDDDDEGPPGPRGCCRDVLT